MRRSRERKEGKEMKGPRKEGGRQQRREGGSKGRRNNNGKMAVRQGSGAGL